MSDVFVHPTAIVEDGVEFKDGVKVWHFAHIRNGVKLGPKVSIGKSVYVDANVRIGEGARIQNSVNIFSGVNISDWCFVGPSVVFTNDLSPRVGVKQWNIVDTYLDVGASIGAGAVIRCGIRIGSFSMVGAGAVVTKDIPPFHLALGLPAENIKKVCACGKEYLSLDSNKKELIRDCCHERLSPELIVRATQELGKL